MIYIEEELMTCSICILSYLMSFKNYTINSTKKKSDLLVRVRD
jgi:hypothetical protein